MGGGYTENVDEEHIVGTTLPHADFGDPDCCGCLNGIIRGDHADIVCNECGMVVRTLAAGDLQKAFDQMELTLEMCQRDVPSLRCRELDFGVFKDRGVYLFGMRGTGPSVRRPGCRTSFWRRLTTSPSRSQLSWRTCARSAPTSRRHSTTRGSVEGAAKDSPGEIRVGVADGRIRSAPPPPTPAISPFRRLLPFGVNEFFDVPPEWRSHRRHPTVVGGWLPKCTCCPAPVALHFVHWNSGWQHAA